MDSIYWEPKFQFDSDYFIARYFQYEEENLCLQREKLRLQEEEKNLLALTKLLMEEKNEEKKRNQSELEDSHKAVLELQRQCDLDYRKCLLQRKREEEESFKLALKLQANEDERMREECKEQENEDEQLVAKIAFEDNKILHTKTKIRPGGSLSIYNDFENVKRPRHNWVRSDLHMNK